MTSRKFRICLVTPGHLSSTPRIVKEAEALTWAGYDVHLVAGSYYAPVEPLDRAVLDRDGWQTTLVRTHHSVGVWPNRLRRAWLQRFKPTCDLLTLEQSLLLLCPGLSRLVDAALATGADFFHGHCAAGLAAAAQAAKLRGTAYGFDAEDFHEAESIEMERDPFAHAVIRRVMTAYLNGATLLTASAPLIAAEYMRCYGVRMPVILNVFPRSDAPVNYQPRPPISGAAPARFYWFSQTVGPGRGLEQMLAVMGKMRTPVELHLRGLAPKHHVDLLRGVAIRAGMAHRLKFFPLAEPHLIVRSAAGADLGLSLEESHPLNRDMCLTNKIFAYLLAGIPQLMSSTTAQSAIARELEGAVLLADIARVEETARLLDDFFADGHRVSKAREAAAHLARRYCWDEEKNKLLALFKTLAVAPDSCIRTCIAK